MIKKTEDVLLMLLRERRLQVIAAAVVVVVVIVEAFDESDGVKDPAVVFKLVIFVTLVSITYLCF